MMKHRNLAMFVLIFASFMDLLDVTIVNVALPSMRTSLDASAAHLEWIVSGYMLAFAVVLITGGRLGDIAGRRTVFLVGVTGFTAASLAASLATNGDMLVATRVVQGGFAALMVPQVLASVQALYAPKERAAVFGVIGGVAGMAAVIGPVLGGWLVSADAFGIGWRSIFVLNVPVGIALILATLAVVPNTRSTHPMKLDLAGFVLGTSALVLLVYPLIEGRQQDWPVWIWALLAASLVLFAVFVWHQRRLAASGGSPMVPMSLFSHRGFSAGSVVQASFQGSLAGFALVLTLYLQLGLGFSAIGAGLVLLPFSLGAFVGSGTSVPLAAKAGKQLVILGALLMAGAVAWTRWVVADAGSALSEWDTVATVDVRDAGAASGVYSTFQQFGAALGIAIIGTVFFSKVGLDYSADSLRAALETSTWIVIGGFLLCAVTALLLPPSGTARHDEEETGETLVPAQVAA